MFSQTQQIPKFFGQKKTEGNKKEKTKQSQIFYIYWKKIFWEIKTCTDDSTQSQEVLRMRNYKLCSLKST